MGSFFHVLKANRTKQRPRNWVMFDCEARIRGNPDGGETHTLRLGNARYRRFSHGEHLERLQDFAFRTPAEFWNQALSLCEKDRRLVVVGYNVGYDIRLVEGFQELHKRGYKQKRIYAGGEVLIIEWGYKKHHITVLDAMNFFTGKLETWGDMLGLPKIDVDFRHVTDAKLSEHCFRDVEILDKIMLLWHDFIDRNDLGCFSLTRAGQSLTAFRHRFMKGKIYIHANDRANEIERASYFGGRTECWRIGTLGGGPFYKLDVNSMYPYVMRLLPVPVRLVSVSVMLTPTTIRRLLKHYVLCGEFELETHEPVYPYRDKGDTFYPIGRFIGHLCTPEIRYALGKNHLRKGIRVSIYERSVIFKEYVDYMYRLRAMYQRDGNEVFRLLVKYLMNSLYGKFGQKSEQWKKVDNELGEQDGEYNLLDDTTGEFYRYFVIAGERWNVLGRKESYHSFPSISAHITAAARIYLWRLITQAGRDHVFYCDTDSLWCDTIGKENLTSYLDKVKLGALKLEVSTKKLIIYAPKEYTTDTAVRRKGVKPDAVEVRPGVFQQTQWEGLRGAFATGRTDRVILTPVEKVLVRTYRKGVVHSDGSISPFVVVDC